MTAPNGERPAPSEPPRSEPEGKSIPAHSHRQAMDWSLVLASQDIEVTILYDELGWRLLVAKADYPRARAAIRLYRWENRGWSWQQKLPGTGLLLHRGALGWAFSLLLIHLLNEATSDHLKIVGAMDNAKVHAGQWWRLLTAISLHGDWGHLVANLTTGLLTLGLAMSRFGAAPALLAAYLAGAVGNLFGLLVYGETHRGLGASGMVMGGLGLLALQAMPAWKESRFAARLAVASAAAAGMLFILWGVDPATDVLAHLGGFLGGTVLGGLLAWTPPALLETRPARLICGALLAGLIGGSWAAALR